MQNNNKINDFLNNYYASQYEDSDDEYINIGEDGPDYYESYVIDDDYGINIVKKHDFDVVEDDEDPDAFKIMYHDTDNDAFGEELMKKLK